MSAASPVDVASQAIEIRLAECGITFEEEQIEQKKTISTPMSLDKTGSIRERKLLDMAHLEVESDLLRGIALQKTLRNNGSVWMKSARELSSAQRIERWNRSVKLEHFDVFLSHTWRTNGRRKVLSLLLQSSWHILLMGWALGVLAALPLHFMEDVPSVKSYECESYDYEGTCLFRVYAHYGGMLGWILALLMAPYLPRISQKTCFLDVVSINQAEPELMEKGIYAIGGFLAVSAELQILWDFPYLERLWCVFEMAAFRRCNPKGKIRLTPLFLEAGVFFGLATVYLHTTLNWIFRFFGWPQEIAFPIRLCFLHPLFHYCRRTLHEKREMIYQLRNFEFASVECGSAFDRNFIEAGIRAWYGSEEAFTRYVRGALSDELAEPFSNFRVPRAYWAVLAASLASWEICWVLAMIQSGAPVAAVAWTVRQRCSSLLLDLVMIKLMVWTCDFFAQQSRLNCLKTTLVWAGLAVVLFILWQCYFMLEAAGYISACAASGIILVSFIFFVGEAGAYIPPMYRKPAVLEEN